MMKDWIRYWKNRRKWKCFNCGRHRYDHLRTVQYKRREFHHFYCVHCLAICIKKSDKTLDEHVKEVWKTDYENAED